jgi:hypothetical protein
VGDAGDGAALGLTGVAGVAERLARGERDGLAEPDPVGLGDPLVAGDRVGAVVAGVGFGLWVLGRAFAPEAAGAGRTRM